MRTELVTHVFKGPRFQDHGIEIDALPELIAYQALVVDTAKELWRRHHPGAQKLQKNFAKSLTLKFYHIKEGSTAIPLYRLVSDPSPLLEDELYVATALIAATSNAAANDRPLPDDFPKKVLPLFESYGKTLRPDESFEHHPPTGIGNPFPIGRYTEKARHRLITLYQRDYEDLVEMTGTVTMVRVNRPVMAIALSDGREIEAAFSGQDEETITTALKHHSDTGIRVWGRALFSGDGEIQRITEVEKVSLLAGGEIPYDFAAKPIWEVAQEIMSDVPDEEFDKLPHDLSSQVDHYVYGLPKRVE